MEITRLEIEGGSHKIMPYSYLRIFIFVPFTNLIIHKTWHCIKKGIARKRYNRVILFNKSAKQSVLFSA